jgi:regulatory protein
MTQQPATGIVTELQVQRKNRRRVSLFVDGEFVVGLDRAVVEHRGLKVGDVLTAVDLSRLVEDQDAFSAKQRALHLLSYRGRSRHEIVDRLTRAGTAPGIVERTVRDLEQLGYLDDADFAERFVASRHQTKGYGPRRLRVELRKLGVANEIAENALKQIANEDQLRESALRLARKHVSRGNRGEEGARRRSRLLQYLVRRGYDYELARSISNQALDEELDAESQTP